MADLLLLAVGLIRRSCTGWGEFPLVPDQEQVAVLCCQLTILTQVCMQHVVLNTNNPALSQSQ